MSSATSIVTTAAEPPADMGDERSEKSKDVDVDPPRRHYAQEQSGHRLNSARAEEFGGGGASAGRTLSALEHDDPAALGGKKVFTGVWHEVAFITIVVMAQLVTVGPHLSTIVYTKTMSHPPLCSK